MPPPSLARGFFEQIVEAPDPVTAIRRLINSDPLTPESDYFDCKQEERDPRKKDSKLKETWSESLGGFANAGGGVLIWGLVAHKKLIDGQEIDAVVNEAPITNPQGLKSRLRELQRQATDPPLGSVQIEAYPLPEDATKGFVICFIPEGPYKPYRSEGANKQYYLRAGDSTQVMQRPVLASMFHPRSLAVFQATAQLEFKSPPKQMMTYYPVVCELTCRVTLLNIGTATARGVESRVTWKLPGTKVDFKATAGVCWSNQQDEYGFNLNNPLHPGSKRQVLAGSWRIEQDSVNRVVQGGIVHVDLQSRLSLEFFCENQVPQIATVSFDLGELMAVGSLEVKGKAME